MSKAVDGKPYTSQHTTAVHIHTHGKQIKAQILLVCTTVDII